MYRYAGVRVIRRGEDVAVKWHVSSGRDHLKNGEFKPAFLVDPNDDSVFQVFTELPQAMPRSDAWKYILDVEKFACVRDLMIANPPESSVRISPASKDAVQTGTHLEEVLAKLREKVAA